MTGFPVRPLKDVRPRLKWEPHEGDETREFIARKHGRDKIPEQALRDVVYEAQQILGRCVKPIGDAESSTGLVVGYVQSGKTLSFTTLSALAHDNGFGLIILIAGTLENLRRQTRNRLETDLGLGDDASSMARPWLVIDNPVVGGPSAQSLERHLRTWADPLATPQYKKVCLVVLLKQHKRLANLAAVLENLGPGLLSKVPTLVIDDEADQASLNTFTAKNISTGDTKKSSNYESITRLKTRLPRHTYVQYTATPQANLLIDLDDKLSPEFGELLTPGNGYTGGARLFAKGDTYAREIPPSDAEADANSIAPATLQEALRYFLLGACAVHLSKNLELRTMMVHPSQQTGRHGAYLKWLQDLVAGWGEIASSSCSSDLIEEFAPAYKSLQDTVGPNLPSIDAMAEALPEVLRHVAVREVNSTANGAAPIRWSESSYWALVGGAKLDRGFTVEGLSVTYMPRPLATGNADNLQQRARFYGYKERYLGYCRIFLLPDVLDAFQQYVEHEKDIHQSLKNTRGRELKEWVRQFTLHSSMQPTRKGVIGIPTTELIAQGWLRPKSIHRGTERVAHNRTVLADFREYLENRHSGQAAHIAYPDSYLDERNNNEPNILYEGIPLEFLVDNFLKKLQTEPDSVDQFELAGGILAIRRLLERGEEFADVFAMGSLLPQRRTLTAVGCINQVFQGHSKNYKGDKAFVNSKFVTLQIRTFDLRDEDKVPVAKDVPWYALHIPNALSKRFIIQNGK